MTTITQSDNTIVRAWAARDADLTVVIGRGAPELRDALRARSRAARTPRLVLHVQPADDPADVMRAIDEATSIPGFLPRRITVAAHPDEVAQHGGVVHRLARAVGDATRRYMVSVNTFATNARAFLWHTLRNAAWYGGSTAFASLRGSAAGTPAIIVGAGPSLDDSLDSIADVADHALVIACDTAAPALLQRGVDPDVIAAIDIQPRKAAIIRELSRRMPDALLAQQQYCHPRISNAWHGRRTFMGTPSPAAGLLPELPAIGETLSVAHAAFEVARHLGCSPIVLVGVDLAFTDGDRTHARETFGHWGDPGDGGTRCLDSCPDLVMADGLDGHQWSTLPAMAAMATSFASLIATATRDGIRVVNATVRGLAINGATRGTIHDALVGLPSGEHEEASPGCEPGESTGHRAIAGLPLLPEEKRSTPSAPGAYTPGSPGGKAALRGEELAFDADTVIGVLHATADEPPDALVRQAAFAEWFRDRQLTPGSGTDARRFVSRACRLAADRIARANRAGKSQSQS